MSLTNVCFTMCMRMNVAKLLDAFTFLTSMENCMSLIFMLFIIQFLNLYVNIFY
jgi:hypothetical protein